MKIQFLLVLMALLIVACQNNETTTVEGTTNKIETEINTASPETVEVDNPVVAAVEQAHYKAAFLAKNAVQFDMTLMFGGKERLKGQLTFSTDSKQGRIDLENGKSIYYSGNDVYYSPDFENDKRIRFDAYTWGYFFLFPYKLSDPGTIWLDYENSQLGEQEYHTQKLTFKAGTGDDPDDWYILYADKTSNLIHCAAYIVTANKTQEEAEKDPHAIEYADYIEVEGIPIAQEWKFWGWQAEEGLTKQLGEAKLKNIRFIKPEEDFFRAPADFLKK